MLSRSLRAPWGRITISLDRWLRSSQIFTVIGSLFSADVHDSTYRSDQSVHYMTHRWFLTLNLHILPLS